MLIVGAEGFVFISCFLKRYALFSLEPMPNIYDLVNSLKTPESQITNSK
ncbi:MAG: hypothetical protein RL029_328 [Actinomycetota bacterium]|jgi:hypothetical protein